MFLSMLTVVFLTVALPAGVKSWLLLLVSGDTVSLSIS